MEILDYYVRLMKADWSYEFSDDMDAYTKGKEEDLALKKIAKEKGDQYKTLYNFVAQLKNCKQLE